MCPNAVACTSGTSALHISLLLSGVGPGDEVIVPAVTFIAPVNTVKYAGAEPVFMDCDDYLNMDMEKLSQFLEEECQIIDDRLINTKSKKRIAAVMPVHVFGSLCDMNTLMELSAKYNLTVVEDASEAIGSKMISGKYGGAFAGTIGNFGCLSFNGNKIITTGGGGAIVANDTTLLKKAKYLTCQAKEDGFHYIHNNIGYNYRMTSVQAAMGLAQIEQLPSFIDKKISMYKYYQKAFSEVNNMRLIPVPDYCESNYWFYSLYIDNIKNIKELDRIVENFAKEKIQIRPLWKLNNEQKPYINNQSYKIEKGL